MRQARFEDGDLHIVDAAVPDPRQDEVLVRITAAGVCHSDLSLARGRWAGVPPTGVIGHEAIGVVEALGPGAQRFVEVGDRVILGLGSAGGGYWCGACEYCLRGTPRHCPQAKAVLGTFAEYFSIWAPALVTLPDAVGDLDAPLACAGLTAYGAVKKLLDHRVVPGRPVAVMGAAGGLGHYAVQLVSGLGYDVIGIDIGRERLDFVTSLGAQLAVDAGEAGDVVPKAVGGLDATLVFTPRIDAFQLGLQLLRPTGLFVGVGLPPTSEGDLRVNPFMFLTKDLTLTYSAVGTVQDMRELVDLAAAGRVRTHVSRRGSLSELGSIFAELDEGRYVGRAVVDDLAN